MARPLIIAPTALLFTDRERTEMRTLHKTFLLALAVATLTTACGKGGDGEKKTAVSEAALAEAKTVFAQRCATCHGPEGKGDGPAGQALNPKPRTFADKDWQAKVTDDHLRKIIVGGGPAVGLSPMMAPNPDLKEKPQVIDGLVQIVRDLGGK